MEAIFSAAAKNGKLYYNNPEDFYKYCLEMEGQELHIEMRPIAKLSEKTRMYAYLFGPMMRCAMEGYSAAGWAGVDKTKARYMLQAEFGKKDIYNEKTSKVQTIYEDVGRMSKNRLLKFLIDVLFFLESELNQKVPDSEEWKLKMQTGKNFKRII